MRMETAYLSIAQRRSDRRSFQTGLAGSGAPGTEGAAGGKIEQGRCHAGYLVQRFTPPAVAVDGPDQSVGIRMQGFVQYRVNITHLHDFPGVHDANLIRQTRNHGKIMGNPN